MIKNIVMLFFLILGAQIMQANTLSHLTINNIKIPVISEQSSVIPTGHVEVIFIGGGNMFNPPKKPLARVASVVLNRGTKKLGNVKFAELLESKALDLDIGVGQATLTFTLDFLKEYEELCLYTIRKSYKRSKLNKKHIARCAKKASCSPYE